MAGTTERLVFVVLAAALLLAALLGVASGKYVELGLVAGVIAAVSFAGSRGLLTPGRSGVAGKGQVPQAQVLTRQLQHYARSNQDARVVGTLREALPDWPVRASLISVALELQELRRGAQIAKAAGVSEAITIGIAREAASAAEALWPVAGRVAAVASQGISSPAVDARLAREVEKLSRLLSATRQAREGLALATLHDGREVDLEVALEGLRLAAGQAQEYSG